MPQHYSDPRRESDEYTLPNIETFYWSGEDNKECQEFNCGDGHPTEPGWYWWPCFPGCLPDSDPVGPFATEADALADAREEMDDDGEA